MSQAVGDGEGRFSRRIIPVGDDSEQRLSEAGSGGVEHRRPAWLWPQQGHCTLDKELRRSFGISCHDYECLFITQQGCCAVCGGRPGKQRLDVDHDHDTGVIRGLAHRRCNRMVTTRVVRYLADPPGRVFGLVVPPERMAAMERRRLKARRARQAAAAQRPPVPPTSTPSNVVAAIEWLEQEVLRS